jgi:hypothetical protein
MSAVTAMSSHMHPDKKEKDQNPKPIICQPFHLSLLSIVAAVVWSKTMPKNMCFYKFFIYSYLIED